MQTLLMMKFNVKNMTDLELPTQDIRVIASSSLKQIAHVTSLHSQWMAMEFMLQKYWVKY